MMPDTRATATRLYFAALECGADKQVVMRGTTLLSIMQALFAEERRADLADRMLSEDRRRQRVEMLKRAGSRQAAAGREATPNPPPGRHDRQTNFQFAEAALPPPSSFGLPATRKGR